MKLLKQKFLFFFLLTSMGILLCIIPLIKPHFSVGYAMILPDGFDTYNYPKSSNCDILYNGNIIGGVYVCPYPVSLLDLVPMPHITPENFEHHTKTIIKALRFSNAPGSSGKHFEHSITSSRISDCIVLFDSDSESYCHYLYFSQHGILSLWFDMSRITYEDAISFASKFEANRSFYYSKY